MINKPKRLNLEQKQLLNRARSMGASTALPVFLQDDELVRIISIILLDIGRNDLLTSDMFPEDYLEYYGVPLKWFSGPLNEMLKFDDIYLSCVDEIEDFETYFKCLCELHKRRKKYSLILSAQPLAKMIQVSPRSLLEYGLIPDNVLPSWLTWRKWFYDIDNRSAQETGYLFEPILASALGGIPYGAKNSPIKRQSSPSKGRQVDCITDGNAYEFKLRVTTAASGQGRIGEELEFATDCKSSGYTPILLVLDPTASNRLDELSAAYLKAGGYVYVGEDAWEHLSEKAGPTMATFLSRYVKKPIAEMDKNTGALLDLSVRSSEDRMTFHLCLGDHEWAITRSEKMELDEDGQAES